MYNDARYHEVNSKHVSSCSDIRISLSTEVDTNYRYIDYNGVEFNSIMDMCCFHNIDTTTYYTKQKQGYTLESCLSKTKKEMLSGACVDYNGKHFENIQVMCDAHNVSRDIFMYRLCNGYDLKTCLSSDKIFLMIKNNYYKILEGQAVDHHGLVFTSLRAMCEYHDVDCKTYIHNMEQGCTIETALTQTGTISASVSNTDIETFKQTTTKDITLDAPNETVVKDESVVSRVSTVTLEEPKPIEETVDFDTSELQLELINTFEGSGTFVDYEGNTFSSEEDMCIAHNVYLAEYQMRSLQGYSIKTCLTGEGLVGDEPVMDYNRREFAHIPAMCRFHKVPINVYTRKVEEGCSLKECLTSSNTGN